MIFHPHSSSTFPCGQVQTLMYLVTLENIHSIGVFGPPLTILMTKSFPPFHILKAGDAGNISDIHRQFFRFSGKFYAVESIFLCLKVDHRQFVRF